ncbi:glycoside hydrolase family 9 protein [Marinihelvus fidelis]|nr:glycoside hydrolase family 9 protein [Marinihelvus fidelis]
MGQTLELGDPPYFKARGINVLVYSNWYDGLFSDSKISGVELVHHGVRTATNGDVRLNATPEQWDAIPQFVDRDVDTENGVIRATSRYPDHDFEFTVEVRAVDDGVAISVNLPRALPQALEGRAGFNLEFLPAAYFGKAYIADDATGLFPLYPSGPKEQNDAVAPVPLVRGNRLVLAPDAPERTVTLASADVEMALYDGRAKAQNGWFVVRSLLPAGREGKVLEWTLQASTIDGWTREPVIAHSQVGYAPGFRKRAVIERDPNDTFDGEVSLLRIDATGVETVKSAAPQSWGRWKRYDYLTFDFTDTDEPGLYRLEYNGVKTAPFRIATDVFETTWHPTLDVFFPVQMDHVLVNEAYRVWHGASHLDDALQAPVNHEHFDLYAQGPTTDTPFEPGEHIPGLNVGGWYDAGDYDIRTQTQYAAVIGLVQTWEAFRPERDTTSVDYDRKFVDLHVPDGKPDILQQITHGTLQLLAQHDAVGHAIPGIIVPDISQYTHLGDGLTMTDNLVYDPDMGELESDGFRSGVFDDRWAFTSRSSALNYGSVAGLAAASRALRGFDDALAEHALATAVRAWEDEQGREPDLFRHGNTTGGSLEGEMIRANAELLLATGESRYADALRSAMPTIESQFAFHAVPVLKVLPRMDDAFRTRVRALAEAYAERWAGMRDANPFGVLITEGGWAGNGAVINIALSNWYLHQAFPDLFDAEDVLSGLHYVFGTHPDSDISFVSAVGAESKKVAYGMNRADFSFIAGGIVPGVLILKPDLPENREDWPFLWGQNEYVINLGGSYLFLANAAHALVNEGGDD